ncbi:MAG: hypothetical protein AB7Q29_01365 [Vicinamibacterales bacterium]
MNASLLVLPASPVIWAAHFLLCYVTAAVWCAKAGTSLQSLDTVRWGIAAYTVVALAGIAVVARAGFRAHTLASPPSPHDVDSPESRHGFLGFAALILSGLSAVAVCYTALAAVFIGSCE